MRIAALILTIIALLDIAQGATVLEAIKMLPKKDRANLARIEGFDGAPVPERWHLVVYEPESISGVKEYVVANGELVTSRGISQFAERLSPNDVIGDAKVKIDSDKLAELAGDYADANAIEVAKMSYHIAPQAPGTPPSWRVQCMNAEGKALGTLMVNAETGDVLSHEGFAAAPSPDKKSSRTAKAKTEDSPRASSGSRSSRSDPEPIASRERTSRSRSAQRERSSRQQRPEVRRAEPVASSRGIGGFMRRLFKPRD